MTGVDDANDEVRSPAQRARDARLGWIIVLCCAPVALTLAVLVAAKLIDDAVRGFDAGQRQQRAEIAAERRAQAVERRAQFATTAQSIPPDTATPIGNPSRWLTAARRPEAALVYDEQEPVRVTLAVGADGVPTGCSIAQSSGFSAIDNGTCQVLIWAGDFEPARPGEPGAGPGEVRRWTSPPIDWRQVR